MATLADFVTQVQILLGPNNTALELTGDDIETLVMAAVERYSRDRPDEATDDVTGDGGKYYPLVTSDEEVTVVLASWVEDFSTILSIEYPAQAIATNTIPQHLDAADWHDDYWQGGGRYLFLPNHNPAATETLRVKYAVPYIWDDGVVATAAQDFYAISHLAAGLCCQAIATKYSRTNDSTIAADSVAHTSRATEFDKRADKYIAFYERHLGLDTDPADGVQQPAAGQFIDFDTAPGWPLGRDYLFHDRSTR